MINLSCKNSLTIIGLIKEYSSVSVVFLSSSFTEISME